MYSLFLLITFGLPAFVLFAWKHKTILHYRKVVVAVFLGSLLFGIPWDLFGTLNKVWLYPEEVRSKTSFFILPIENLIFYLFACLTLSFLVIIFRQKNNLL